jgi:uncharacterized OB-fold protein
MLTLWDEMDVCVSLDVNNDCCCYCGIEGSEMVAITTRWNIITYLCSLIAIQGPVKSENAICGVAVYTCRPNLIQGDLP